MSVGWMVGIVVVAVVGTFAWLGVFAWGASTALRLPPEERAAVPTALWVTWLAALCLAVIWPLGLLASSAALAVGGLHLRTPGEGARRMARVTVAQGASFLALALGVAALAMVYVAVQG